MGHIHADQSGDLHLDLSNCALCHLPHRTPIAHTEQKLLSGGRPALYWTQCPSTGHILILRAAIGHSIDICSVEPPMRNALRKAK